ncbi:cuticle protein [Penaeus vannamei]|uniref:cuticle protein n=1 Tax=Penaeus vannamei TaxID=6689 RepID=UPI000F68A2BE|nr:cuticle protein-like [Penaeus vannamei]
MISKVVLLLVPLAAVLALPADLNTYKQEGMPYNFAYAVKDDYAGSDFGAQENSDGNTVRGSYTVALPDGRKQTVNYEADHHKGFVAEVNYYGEAQYPHESGPAITFKPKYQSSGNGYQPQPSYQ